MMEFESLAASNFHWSSQVFLCCLTVHKEVLLQDEGLPVVYHGKQQSN
uniref:Uncharacterized protein n=1 Tax=Arundo donax TaxID=35708 RepID=A0A0A8ZX87_ARUDO